MADMTAYRPKNDSYLRHWFRRNEEKLVRIALGVSLAITIGFAFLFFGRR